MVQYSVNLHWYDDSFVDPQIFINRNKRQNVVDYLKLITGQRVVTSIKSFGISNLTCDFTENCEFAYFILKTFIQSKYTCSGFIQIKFIPVIFRVCLDYISNYSISLYLYIRPIFFLHMTAEDIMRGLRLFESETVPAQHCLPLLLSVQPHAAHSFCILQGLFVLFYTLRIYMQKGHSSSAQLFLTAAFQGRHGPFDDSLANGRHACQL